jgi:hypothetical protein
MNIREGRQWVYHKPEWVPAMLRIDAKGTLKPGFECAHLLENGNGRCSGSASHPTDEIYPHACIVTIPSLWRRIRGATS